MVNPLEKLEGEISGRGLLVVGAARSGTSALAGALGACGADLGSNHIPADPDNPKGYCEPRDIIEAHDRFLLHCGEAWHSFLPISHEGYDSDAGLQLRKDIRDILTRRFADVNLWAVKDPRFNRLVPLWAKEFTDVDLNVIIPIRHPFEVANSLSRFNHMDWSSALIYWLWHVFESERNTRNFNRVLTSYSDLLTDPEAVISKIEDGLRFHFPVPPQERSIRLHAWIDPKLHRYNKHSDPSNLIHELSSNRLTSVAVDLYLQLTECDLLNKPKEVDALFHSTFGSGIYDLLSVLKHERSNLRGEILASTSRNNSLQKSMEQLLSEKSVLQKERSDLRDEILASSSKNDSLQKSVEQLLSENLALDSEKKMLQMQVHSMGEWMRGPWRQRVFHRWHNSSEQHIKRNLWRRLGDSVRKRVRSCFPAINRRADGHESF